MLYEPREYLDFPCEKRYIDLERGVIMPGPEFEKLLNLCFQWINHDAEYIFDCTLKADAPDFVKKAFDKLKKMQKKYDDACILV